LTFGEALREAREARGWSRFRLTVAVRDAFRAERVTITEQSLKLLELGRTKAPRRITIRLLTRVLPEITHNYQPIEP
jgi:transcriptional regulator with XRE-family HTH domain